MDTNFWSWLLANVKYCQNSGAWRILARVDSLRTKNIMALKGDRIESIAKTSGKFSISVCRLEDLCMLIKQRLELWAIRCDRTNSRRIHSKVVKFCTFFSSTANYKIFIGKCLDWLTDKSLGSPVESGSIKLNLDLYPCRICKTPRRSRFKGFT